MEPAKLRPGYVNCAVEQPPLKLIEGEPTFLDHLGVEVFSTEGVCRPAR